MEIKVKFRVWLQENSNQLDCCSWSPAASTLQPLLQTRSLPGFGDPQHLLLLDHTLIDSCHTCHLSMMSHWGHLWSENGRFVERVIDRAGKFRPRITMIANPGVHWIFAEMRDYILSRGEMRLLVLMQGHVSFRYCDRKRLLGMCSCSQPQFIENLHRTCLCGEVHWNNGERVELIGSIAILKENINVVSFNDISLCILG